MPTRVGIAHRVVDNVGVAVVGLQVVGVGQYGVRRVEPAQHWVVHPPVHVHQAEQVVMLVAGEAPGQLGAGLRPCQRLPSGTVPFSAPRVERGPRDRAAVHLSPTRRRGLRPPSRVCCRTPPSAAAPRPVDGNRGGKNPSFTQPPTGSPTAVGVLLPCYPSSLASLACSSCASFPANTPWPASPIPSTSAKCRPATLWWIPRRSWGSAPSGRVRAFYAQWGALIYRVTQEPKKNYQTQSHKRNEDTCIPVWIIL